MSVYCNVSERRPEGEKHRPTDRTSGEARRRVAVACASRRNKRLNGGRSLVSCLVLGSLSFAICANSQVQADVNIESSRAIVLDRGTAERRSSKVVPEALIEQLSDKWRAEAMAGTSDAQMPEEHRALLVDALSRVNWTPLCSYTEESIESDEEEVRIRHHTFEFDRDASERLIELIAEYAGFNADTENAESDGFVSTLDEFGGMREDLAAAKVIDTSDLTVIYELPVPREVLEEDASAEEMEGRFMKKMLENLRVRFTVDTQNRGPKEMRVELLKPVRVIPGVKIKKMNFTTSFRYLEDVQEFAAYRNAMEMSARAFLVAGFSENESKTLSDFQCVGKG